MRIFGRERASLTISKSRAVRALYMDGPGTEQVEVHLLTDDGQRLDLQFRPNAIPDLISQLEGAYEAINPPLSRRRNAAAQWDGEGTGA